MTSPKTIVQWPTPWTQAHWFAAVGGALGTLLLVVCIWLLGSSRDTNNHQLQQQIVALEEKLATAEKAAVAKLAAEKLAAEKAEAEKAAMGKAAAEKAAAEKLAAERAAAEEQMRCHVQLGRKHGIQSFLEGRSI